MAKHAILRFEKHKGNPARPLEAHHERQKEQYASNPDIDTSRSKYNFHIVSFSKLFGGVFVSLFGDKFRF